METSSSVAPGPQGLPFFGNLFEMRRDPMGLLMRSTRDYGSIVKLKFGPQTAFLVSHPDLLKHVFVDHSKNYLKQTKAWKIFQLIFGEGLLTSEGELWRKQRKLMQPSFHRERIASFVEVMSRATGHMLKSWSTLEEKPSFDLSSEMMKLTLEIVGETLLGAKMGHQAQVIAEALPVVLEFTVHRVTEVFNLPIDFPSPRNIRFRKALKALRGVAEEVIRDRVQSPDDRGDLLSMLMSARDEETKEGMSDEQLLDEVMTIFLAGHETTANALTWAFYLLSKNPKVEQKIREELSSVLENRVPRFEDLPKLVYLERVIKEALRLYPPAWFMGRLTMSDDQMVGYDIPKNSIVFLSPYVTHHQAAYWEDPERFDPDRFLPERFAKQHRFSYIPFGAGPRQCIGNHFAIMEAQVILAMILQKYHLSLAPNFKVEMDPQITLRPKDGMQMHLERIKPS